MPHGIWDLGNISLGIQRLFVFWVKMRVKYKKPLFETPKIGKTPMHSRYTF
jgi:hypothetical protein